MSVNVGQTESFKIDTPASSYHIEILRLGYYGGDGARVVASERQADGDAAADTAGMPDQLRDRADRLRQLGRLGLLDGAEQRRLGRLHRRARARRHRQARSQIPFVVRNDASHSEILLQTSDATWEAYNDYGGNSLYTCTVACPPGEPEAYKGAYSVSYNRPFEGAFDDRRRRLLPVVRRIPDDALARRERLRRQLHERGRSRPATARC